MRSVGRGAARASVGGGGGAAAAARGAMVRGGEARAAGARRSGGVVSAPARAGENWRWREKESGLRRGVCVWGRFEFVPRASLRLGSLPSAPLPPSFLLESAPHLVVGALAKGGARARGRGRGRLGAAGRARCQREMVFLLGRAGLGAPALAGRGWVHGERVGVVDRCVRLALSLCGACVKRESESGERAVGNRSPFAKRAGPRPSSHASLCPPHCGHLSHMPSSAE